MRVDRLAQDDSETPSFAWPPRNAEHGQPPVLDQQKSSTETSHFGALIDSIETDLLGRTTLAFDRWADRNGWEPDHPNVYCWRCAGSVGPHEHDGEGCASCRTKKLSWNRALRLGRYENELRDEILSLKLQAWRPGGAGLGKFLGRVIADQLSQAHIRPDQARLVPVPTHRWRRIARGVDHTLVLTRAASDASGCPVNSVLRARYRPDQVGLSATARAANMKGAFECRKRQLQRSSRESDNPARVWVLIDDVRTTGATFAAASKMLRKGLNAGSIPSVSSEIWVCSVAVAGERDRRINQKMTPELKIRAGAEDPLI